MSQFINFRIAIQGGGRLQTGSFWAAERRSSRWKRLYRKKSLGLGTDHRLAGVDGGLGGGW